MHMADALVSPPVAGTMLVASAAAAGVSIYKLRQENDEKRIPAMGVMGAFVFAAQMINFTIPGTGSSGHLCGGMMLSAILGPYAGFLTMIGVLLIQCLFFADGGLMAIGCNIWNMAFYGCFVGALLIWKPIIKNGVNKTKIAIASIVACVLTLQLGAFSVTVETMISGITELPFKSFLGVMQPIHLAIGFVEGLITAAVLIFIYEARPELLWGMTEKKENKFSLKKTFGIIVLAAFITGGLISLLASSFPDGLEWSMEKIAGTSELESSASAAETAAKIQEKSSFLPDYAFKSSDSAVGTSVSGLVGALIVLVLCIVACRLFGFFMNRKTKTVKKVENNE